MCDIGTDINLYGFINTIKLFACLAKKQARTSTKKQAIFGRYILSDKGDFPSYIGASGV